jgi:hypothetical protein
MPYVVLWGALEYGEMRERYAQARVRSMVRSAI